MTATHCTRRCAGALNALDLVEAGRSRASAACRPALQHRQGRGRDQTRTDRAEHRRCASASARCPHRHRRVCTCGSVPCCRRRAGALRGNLRGPSCRPATSPAPRSDRSARDLGSTNSAAVNACDFGPRRWLFSQAGLTAFVVARATSPRPTPPTSVALEQLDSGRRRRHRHPGNLTCRLQTPDPHPASRARPQTRQTIVRLLSSIGQRQGNQPVPEALLAARRRALRGWSGRLARCCATTDARWCRRWRSCRTSV